MNGDVREKKGKKVAVDALYIHTQKESRFIYPTISSVLIALFSFLESTLCLSESYFSHLSDHTVSNVYGKECRLWTKSERDINGYQSKAFKIILGFSR